MHKKHGIKLTESKMEPGLLVQTRVPGRGARGRVKTRARVYGKGTNVETWKGKCQLGNHSAGQ